MEMLRKMWMLFILTMAGSSAEESKNFQDDKEQRFLSLFALSASPRPVVPPPPRPVPLTIQPARCAARLETALDQIKRRQMTKARNSESPLQMIDLDGYSLTQNLRSIPMNMYVTRMRVRLPQNQNWVRIDRCFFDPRNVSLETRLLFNDLTISGSVNLQESDELDRNEERRRDRDTFYENRNFEGEIQYRNNDNANDDRLRRRNDYHERNRRECNMILRLRKAGIGFFTQPLNQSPGRFSVKTDSEFIEPGFISVYAYGCEKYITKFKQNIDRSYYEDDFYRNRLDKRHKRQADTFRFDPYSRDDDYYYGRSLRDRDDDFKSNGNSKLFVDDDMEDLDDISREMEEIFTKGIRSLLTTYMQKELQPAIKETLMRNLGYTISYG